MTTPYDRGFDAYLAGVSAAGLRLHSASCMTEEDRRELIRGWQEAHRMDNDTRPIKFGDT
jgi:hypothetical protein